jgi:hypothetical protein
MRLSLGAVDEESLLNGLLLLSTLLNVLASTLCGTTKDKLSLELPLLGNVPVTLCLLVDLEWTVKLAWCPSSLSQRSNSR